MKMATLSKPNKSGTQTIEFGKLPVVVLSLDEFEKMKEDLEMYQSKNLRKEIAKARKEKTVVSLGQLLKKYNI